MTITTRLQTFDPETATEYLTKNTNNRTLKQSRITAMAREMARGGWQANGSTIVVSDTGKILDGQHRLYAVVKSGATIESIVVEGVAESAMPTLDSGSSRSFADVLKLRGEVQCNDLSSATRSVVQWQSGIRHAIGHGGGSKWTNNELLDALDENPWIRDELSHLKRVTRAVPIPMSTVAALWWEFYGIDPDDCRAFFGELSDGIDRAMSQPLFVLASTLLDAQARSRVNLTHAYKAAITIKAWNAYRDGREVGLLRYKPGGASPEKFPEAH